MAGLAYIKIGKKSVSLNQSMLIKCFIKHLVTFSNCWDSLKVNKYQNLTEMINWPRKQLGYGNNFINLRNQHPIKFIDNLMVQRLNVNGGLKPLKYSLLRRSNTIKICLTTRYQGIAINCYIQELRQKINKTCKYLIKYMF